MNEATRVGLVYVLLRVSDRHVKIGKAFEDVFATRLADLRLRYGDMTVMHTETTPNPSAVERLAHKALTAHRRYGELFEVTPEVAIDAVRQAAEKVEAQRGAHGFAAMQIRSVPKLVRDFFNEMARKHDCTLGELLTRIAEGEITIQPMGTAQPVAAQAQIGALSQAAQALVHVANASGQRVSPRTAASLNAAIASEVRRMRALPATVPPKLLEGQRHE
jgi:hypothetical protein